MDGRNRRVGKKVNGTLQRQWIYGGQLRPVAEYGPTGTLTATYIYGTHINIPDYIIKNGVTYRVITDHLGSLRFVINSSNGSIAQRIDYDDWGNVLVNTAPDFAPFGFAGGIYDKDTKLTRFGARDYDAEVGRWTTKDPIGFKSLSLNHYEYVFSNPINFQDPTGLGGCTRDCIKKLRQSVKEMERNKKVFSAIGALSGASVVGSIGFMGGFAAFGLGEVPGAIGGAIVGGALGYFGFWEGYGGYEWLIAYKFQYQAFSQCMKDCGVCDEELTQNIFEYVQGGY